MLQKEHPDQYIIKGIIREDPKVIKEIYKTCSKPVINLVKRNNGSMQDAEDVFQETIIIILKKAKRSEIILTSKFTTYFLGVCRFVWLKKLREKDNKMVTLDPNLALIDSTDIETMIEKRERHTFYLQKMKQLSAECQQLIGLYVDGKKMKEIAKVMGYKTAVYARKRKLICKERFLNRIKQDKKYSEFVID